VSRFTVHIKQEIVFFMTLQKWYYPVSTCLLLFSILLVAWKKLHNDFSLNQIAPKQSYVVNYAFDLFNMESGSYVKAYIPESNYRQHVDVLSITEDSISRQILSDPHGKSMIWRFQDKKDAIIEKTLEVEIRPVKYDLPEYMHLQSYFPDSILKYLGASEHIQSEDETIKNTADSLVRLGLHHTLRATYDYVYQIENSSTSALTDAATTLRRKQGSCNGKSRLFVALCRAQGIPARVVGGLILEDQVSKRTSHLWAEIYHHGHWIPFDVLNNYYAELPAHYLEIYRGDAYLITRSADIGFDYGFNIAKKHQAVSFLTTSAPRLWGLLSTLGIPLGVLRSLLLLPLAALVIALCKNVIGIKAFGIFLPALIALALVKVHLGWGLFTFGLVISVIGLLHFPLERAGILHTPKIVIMLTCVVIILLLLGALGLNTKETSMAYALFLPIIVLCITAERFAKVLVEEQLRDALNMLGATFFIALICYPIFHADFLIGIFLTYPELYLSIIAIMLFLGRWIGLRLNEYKRFALLASA